MTEQIAGKNPDGSWTLDKSLSVPLYTPEAIKAFMLEHDIEESSDDFGSSKSGNYGHKGRKGKRGGSLPRGGVSAGAGVATVTHDVKEETIDRWEKEIETWPDDGRQGMAKNALNDIRSRSTGLSIEEGGELKGIASITVPRTRKTPMGDIEPSKSAGVTGSFLATKEKGYGRQMMKGMAQAAADENRSLTFNATKKSLPFYKAIGMEPISEGYKMIHLKPDEVKTWLAQN